MAFHDLKDLLRNSINRANIVKEVDSVHVIDIANSFLHANLPKNKSADAKAVSLRNGIITIACRHSAAAQFINSKKLSMLKYIRERSTETKIKKITTILKIYDL